MILTANPSVIGRLALPTQPSSPQSLHFKIGHSTVQITGVAHINLYTIRKSRYPYRETKQRRLRHMQEKRREVSQNPIWSWSRACLFCSHLNVGGFPNDSKKVKSGNLVDVVCGDLLKPTDTWTVKSLLPCSPAVWEDSNSSSLTTPLTFTYYLYH